MRADHTLFRALSRRPGRSFPLLLAATFLTWLGCGDGSTTPGGSSPASLSFSAVFPAEASIQQSLIDEWRVEVTRPGDGVIAADGGPVNPGQHTVELRVSVVLQGGCETLRIRAELLSAGDPMYRAEDSFVVCLGDGNLVRNLVFEWVGPAPPAIAPEEVSFFVAQGETQTRAVTVTYGGAGSVSWSAQIEGGGPGWLDIEPTAGTVSAAEPQTMTLTVDAEGMAVGRAFANVTVEGVGFPFPLTRLLVELNVTPGPQIELSPNSLAITADEGVDPPAEDFAVTNSGGGLLNWSASEDATWLGLSPISGVRSGGQSETVAVTVQSAGLNPGEYHATITVSSGDASNSPQTLPVSLSVVDGAQPDLIVSSLTHTPEKPSTDGEFVLAAIVRNQGAALAEASALRISLGDEDSTHDLPPLGPGQNFVVEQRVGPLPAGDHIVTATVDPSNAVEESDETNNQKTHTVTVEALPDLAVSSFSHSPSNPHTEDAITITAVVYNYGRTLAKASILTLQLDGGAPTTHNVPALAPGQSAPMELQVGPLSSGSHLVTAIVDSPNAVWESDETNNHSAHTFAVGTLSDLVVSSLTHTPTSPNTNNGITITAVVRNQGNASAGASVLRISLGEGGSTHNVPGLGPGEEFGVQSQLAPLPAGEHTITARADDADVIEELDEANNETTDPLMVLGLPDLVVSSLTHSPEDPDTNDEVIITAVVRNDGNATAGASVLRLRFTGTSHNVPSLEPGQTFQVQQSAGTRLQGSYSVRAMADLDNTIEESNEENNEGGDTFTVRGLPDLVVSSLTHSPLNPSSVDEVILTAVVRNDGNMTAGASVLRLRFTGTSHNVPSLEPGQTFEVQQSAGTRLPGSYTVRAMADLDNTVEESNEENNEATHPFSVVPGPDLVVSSLTHSPADPIDGDAVTITAVVENIGGTGAGASTLDINTTPRGGGSTSGNWIAVPALAPGATETVTQTLTSFYVDTWDVEATADVEGQVTEDNEDNNQATDQFTVSELPDLVVSSLTNSPLNPTTSDVVTITSVVRNDGGSPAGASVLHLVVEEYEYYREYWADVPALTPGSTHQVQQVLHESQPLYRGTFTVSATADVEGEGGDLVEESDEGNNVESINFQVVEPPRLELFPDTLWFYHSGSSDDPAPDTFFVTSRGDQPLNWSATVNYHPDPNCTNWLTASPLSGSGLALNEADTVTVDPTTCPLIGSPPYSHKATVLVTSNGGTDSVVVVYWNDAPAEESPEEMAPEGPGPNLGPASTGARGSRTPTYEPEEREQPTRLSAVKPSPTVVLESVRLEMNPRRGRVAARLGPRRE
ncbi:CARDB domain-containing protein [Gemmatimonadota bacterium]